jgi:hypothetical protein
MVQRTNVAGQFVCGAIFAATILGLLSIAAADQTADELARQFKETTQPLLKTHCFDCHAGEKAEAKLDLSAFDSHRAVAEHPAVWQRIRQRLEAGEMPPEDAPRPLEGKERRQLIEWIKDAEQFEVEHNAGDPGRVLARRLSNAEFDYSIRDLTGVEIRPTREFPVDPANEAGFDNSGESLAMSPALLQKYLAAARHVADHVVLKPQGFVFAPHPTVTETDRDKYCVQRIMAFYERHQVDYADYFLAAWRFHHRERLVQAGDELPEFAAEAGLSAKYLPTIWSVLNDPLPEIGPLAQVRGAWRKLQDETDEQRAREGCERLRDLVIKLRNGNELAVEIPQLKVQGISPGSQPLVLWRNRQSAASHMKYASDAQGDERAALDRFCHDFPRTFVVTDRGPYFDPKQAGQGRLLTAGFHLMQGYFRDDKPLYELALSESQRQELDALWQELDFIAQIPQRQYADFIFFERAEPPRFMREEEFDFARSEDKDANSPEKMARLKELHLAKAKRNGAGDEALAAIDDYYKEMNERIRRVERERLAAESSHLADLLKFAERAWRRPLTETEKDELRAFYRTLRESDKLGHEEALRDTLASVLLSPHFCYRFDLVGQSAEPQQLSDYALASRLSYFLWSSLPDEELLAHAAAGDLHDRDVLLAKTRRMLANPKVRGLATEFGGNWLDFRRFEEHNSVDRERFPAFTPELRQAMFEEPVRFLVDTLQNNRPVVDLLYADHTFVNSALARHYGIPVAGSPATNEWVRVENGAEFGRGGLLPMAVFQTKNSPGLRTSPVKRGYWVVRRLLGEHIPPPPPTVPELPKDEAKLGELTLPHLLARHRADRACAGCHQRFDAIGLAFEGYGPIGERRSLDLGGRPVHNQAEFPSGGSGTGLAGLQQYLREKRQDEFVDNFCRKLLAYALSRGLLLSDEKLIATMKSELAADEFRIQNAIEAIVVSRQFQYHRGREQSTAIPEAKP